MTNGQVWALVFLYSRYSDWRNWVVPAAIGGVVVVVWGAMLLWDARFPRPARRPVRRPEPHAPSDAATYGCCFAIYLVFLAFVGALFLASRGQ